MSIRSLLSCLCVVSIIGWSIPASVTQKQPDYSTGIQIWDVWEVCLPGFNVPSTRRGHFQSAGAHDAVTLAHTIRSIRINNNNNQCDGVATRLPVIMHKSELRTENYYYYVNVATSCHRLLYTLLFHMPGQILVLVLPVWLIWSPWQPVWATPASSGLCPRKQGEWWTMTGTDESVPQHPDSLSCLCSMSHQG